MSDCIIVECPSMSLQEMKDYCDAWGNCEVLNTGVKGKYKLCGQDAQEVADELKSDGYIDESLSDEYKSMSVSDDDLKGLKKTLDDIGFNVTSVKRYGDSVHIQILSKEGNKTKDDLEHNAQEISKILDDFEDNTMSPCTYNLGLQTDGYLSAGIDCREIFYKPGDDTSYKKSTKIEFNNGKPASDYDKMQLKAIGDKMGMSADDVANFVPADKHESLDDEGKVKIDKIDKYVDDLYAMRKDAIAKGGEFSIGNLVFKELRNLGYLDSLKQMKTELMDQELSLEGLDEEYVGEVDDVVPLAHFLKECEELGITEDQIKEVKDAIKSNPNIGKAIKGSHGGRKLRVAIEGNGKGKSGGARVIYANIYVNKTSYLIDIYSKSEKEDLTPKEVSLLAKIIDKLKKDATINTEAGKNGNGTEN